MDTEGHTTKEYTSYDVLWSMFPCPSPDSLRFCSHGTTLEVGRGPHSLQCTDRPSHHERPAKNITQSPARIGILNARSVHRGTALSESHSAHMALCGTSRPLTVKPAAPQAQKSDKGTRKAVESCSVRSRGCKGLMCCNIQGRDVLQPTRVWCAATDKGMCCNRIKLDCREKDEGGTKGATKAMHIGE